MAPYFQPTILYAKALRLAGAHRLAECMSIVGSGEFERAGLNYGWQHRFEVVALKVQIGQRVIYWIVGHEDNHRRPRTSRTP